MLNHHFSDRSFVLTDGGELSQNAILISLRAAIRDTKADVLWVADDLAQAIWEGISSERLRACKDTAEFVDRVRQMLCDVGFGELAPYFRMASTVQHLSLAECVSEPPFKDAADFQVRVRASIRSFHQLGVRTLYVTGLSACERQFEIRDTLLLGTRATPQRSKIVALVREELGLLRWPYPLKCYLA